MNDAVVIAGRYELAEVLGRGGMADVHRATDRVLHREVALKLLRDTAHSETDRLRFTAEARTLAGLNHAGIVLILDAGIATEQPFLVMELIEGPTLAQACAAETLSPGRVASIGSQLAKALAYAHEQGIIHRDVKPGNVLLGADGRVKLADFGIARLIGETVRHTKTGTAIGTAAYLSPEQVGGEEVTPASDVYSLGLVLLEALTGERAYPGTPMESALARLSRAPQIPERLSEEWRGLLHEMTRRDPRDRPPPTEVAERLRAEASGPVPVPTDRRPATGDETKVMTQPQQAATVAMPSGAPPAAGVDEHVSWTDRAGDWMVDRLHEGRRFVRGMSSSQRGLAATLLALGAFIVIVAIAAGGDTPESEDPLPRNVPADLEQPLRELHDAVNGG